MKGRAVLAKLTVCVWWGSWKSTPCSENDLCKGSVQNTRLVQGQYEWRAEVGGVEGQEWSGVFILEQGEALRESAA